MTWGIITLVLFGLMVVGAGVLAWYGTVHNWHDDRWKKKPEDHV